MRPMRRSDRATTVEKAWEILENAEFMTLSMMGAEGVPYGVTLSFARVGSALYFHCANTGYKLAICKKYAPENAGAAAYIAQYPQVSVWRIDVTDISGKIHD